MISIFIFSKIANEVANEKVSKSIEYVLTSVTEKEYLLAKIISVISIILIQAIFGLVYYMIGNLLNSAIMLANGVDLATNSEAIIMSLDKDIIAYICVVLVYTSYAFIKDNKYVRSWKFNDFPNGNNNFSLYAYICFN